VLRFLVFLNGIAAVCLLFAYLSSYVDPNTFGLLSVFGLLFPIFFIVNVFFLLFWVFAQIKYSLISGLILVLSLGHVSSYFKYEKPSGVENKKHGKKELTIASFNVQIGGKIFNRSPKKTKQNKQILERELIDKDIDIYILQEVNKRPKEMFTEYLPDYNKFYEKGKIQAFFSKHPILEIGEIEIGTVYNTCYWADIKLPGETIRIYNFHLSSNNVTKKVGKLIKQPDLSKDNTWSDINGVFKNYALASAIRVKEVRMIKEHIANSPYPVILSGDMNDTPLSYSYRIMRKNLQDAFVTAGSGIGATYAGGVPFLRIDYTFVDPKFEIISHEIIKEDFSDHYPIITTINLSE